MKYLLFLPVLLLLIVVGYGIYPQKAEQSYETQKRLELEQRIEALEKSSVRHQERIDALFELRNK